MSLNGKINKAGSVQPNHYPQQCRLWIQDIADLHHCRRPWKSATAIRETGEVLHNPVMGFMIHQCPCVWGRSQEGGDEFKLQGKRVWREFLGTETGKCQIPTLTLKPANGWIGSKIGRVTDGSGRKKYHFPQTCWVWWRCWKIWMQLAWLILPTLPWVSFLVGEWHQLKS